jgi:hypothetical protein
MSVRSASCTPRQPAVRAGAFFDAPEALVFCPFNEVIRMLLDFVDK